MDSPKDTNPTPTEPSQPTPPVQNNDLEKVGEHALSNGEMVLFGEIYQSFERLKVMMAKFMTEKFGYKDDDPIGFEFNWQNHTVTAFRQPTSNIEVAKDMPSAPTPPASGKTT